MHDGTWFNSRCSGPSRLSPLACNAVTQMATDANFSPRLTLESREKQLILDVLSRAKGNASEAARALRIGRDAFRYKMKKHELVSNTPNSKAAAAGERQS
jgi:DNA-binding NtrC family response regulator